MKQFLVAAFCTFALACVHTEKFSHRADYYPPAGHDWQRLSAAEAGFDARLLEEAVAFAKTQETEQAARDFSTQSKRFGVQLAPLPKSRALTNGMILRHGYIVAEWGETENVDPTYSIAKSFLSAVLGLAIDRGMIQSIDDPVKNYVHDGGYDSPHNSKITWRHHATQTSEWEGSMFGKSHDFVGEKHFGIWNQKPRELKNPGDFWEYNDVRINRLSSSLMTVWKRPLPEVIKQYIMDPIGASDAWKYHGYKNSEVVVDGKKMIAVSGGTRWGGGLWISTRDEARFGHLFLKRGRWGGQQILSENWVKQTTTPAALGPDYGFLWWLNTKRKMWPSAPVTSFAAVGAGSNTMWIDPEHDLVVVVRWHKNSGDEIFKRVLAALK